MTLRLLQLTLETPNDIKPKDINHVSKYGPREWSSIHSKGLLHRTGKSCRLRWVNKLRPDLKNGCKFSVEEERLVIEMQAQIGNKWATIATYLQGRTDNDVKNFWSSRQKRLARMRPAAGSSTSSSTNHISSSTYNNTQDLDILSLQVQDDQYYNLPMEEMIKGDIGDDSLFSNSTQSSSLFSAYISHEPESMRMVELPALMMMNLSNTLNGVVEANKEMIPTTTTTTSNGNPNNEISSNNVTDYKSEGQVVNEELMAVAETSFMDVFGESGIINDDQLDLLGGFDQEEMVFGEQQQQLTECCCNVEHGINHNGDDVKIPDLFFDDFPSDVVVFDDQMDQSLGSIGSLPSPSN